MNVQRGVTNVGAGSSVDVAITAVNTAKTFIKTSVRGNTISTDNYSRSTVTAELTSSIKLRLTDALNAAHTSTVSWEVIEFH